MNYGDADLEELLFYFKIVSEVKSVFDIQLEQEPICLQGDKMSQLIP